MGNGVLGVKREQRTPPAMSSVPSGESSVQRTPPASSRDANCTPDNENT